MLWRLEYIKPCVNKTLHILGIAAPCFNEAQGILPFPKGWHRVCIINLAQGRACSKETGKGKMAKTNVQEKIHFSKTLAIAGTVAATVLLGAGEAKSAIISGTYNVTASDFTAVGPSAPVPSNDFTASVTLSFNNATGALYQPVTSATINDA